MRKRSQTLAQNLLVYAGIAGVIGFNAWFWGRFTGAKKQEVAGVERSIAQLDSVRVQKERELSTAEERVAEFSREITKRRKELELYGDFLPPLSTRPEVQKFVYQSIEDLKIRILKEEEPKLAARPHYSKLDLRLSLKGSYRDFKLLLARIAKSERFIRITEFKVMKLEDEDHTQTVSMAVQTYFSNSGRG